MGKENFETRYLANQALQTETAWHTYVTHQGLPLTKVRAKSIGGRKVIIIYLIEKIYEIMLLL